MFGDTVVPTQKEILVQALLLLVDEYGAFRIVFSTLGTRFGALVTQRKQSLFVLHGGAGTRLCCLCGGVRVHAHMRTYAHTHKLKEQGSCSMALFFCLLVSTCCGVHGVQFLCHLCHPRAWAGRGSCDLGRSSPVRLFPFWLPRSSCENSCPEPQGCNIPGLGTTYLQSSTWWGTLRFSPVGRECQT